MPEPVWTLEWWCRAEQSVRFWIRDAFSSVPVSVKFVIWNHVKSEWINEWVSEIMNEWIVVRSYSYIIMKSENYYHYRHSIHSFWITYNIIRDFHILEGEKSEILVTTRYFLPQCIIRCRSYVNNVLLPLQFAYCLRRRICKLLRQLFDLNKPRAILSSRTTE